MAFGVTGVALAITLAACTSGSSSPSSAPPSSSSVNIHVSGHVTGDYNKRCAVGTDSVPNQVTVAFVGGAKASSSPLTLVLYVPKSSGSATYSASSTVAAVRLTTTKTPTYNWANNYPGASGTMTISGGGSSGNIDMTLVPTPVGYSPANQATGNVQVQGSWAGCTIA